MSIDLTRLDVAFMRDLFNALVEYGYDVAQSTTDDRILTAGNGQAEYEITVRRVKK